MAKNRPTGLTYKRKPLVDRFWAKVDKRGPDECWEWTGHRMKSGGYGAIGSGGKYAPNLRAHVYSWGIHNGAIPEGAFVLHRCDNPACVNPNHLFLGTQAENMEDMDAKGRRIVGARHKGAKLTNETVRSIKTAYSAGGTTIRKLAAEYGVSSSAISKIVLGKMWKHI